MSLARYRGLLGGMEACSFATGSAPDSLAEAGETMLAMLACSPQPFGSERARQARRRTPWMMQLGAIDDAALAMGMVCWARCLQYSAIGLQICSINKPLDWQGINCNFDDRKVRIGPLGNMTDRLVPCIIVTFHVTPNKEITCKCKDVQSLISHVPS